MQFRTSRQLVTGLTVNAKVNIRPEYYRRARAMCHRLFETGEYHRPVGAKSVQSQPNGQAAKIEPIKALSPLEGILSHIHHVKDTVDDRDKKEKKENATAARKLYARFLKYRYFVRLERPLIVCEGKTDNIYLKHAIRRLTDFHPKLGSEEGTTFTSAVAFFKYTYTNQAHRILDLNGGTGDLLYFFIKKYEHDIQSFKHRPLKHPVIVLIDNDSGAKGIFAAVSNSKNYSIKINHKSSAPFFHVTDNLYLVKTPGKGSDGVSCIEDFFDSSLLQKELEGKKFNPADKINTDSEYGKWPFATQVVQPNAAAIDFTGFAPLLERIAAVIDNYKQRIAATA